MELLYELETHMEREFLLRLQESLQHPLSAYRLECPECGLMMRRHHRYLRYIMTRYGEVQLQV